MRRLSSFGITDTIPVLPIPMIFIIRRKMKRRSLTSLARKSFGSFHSENVEELIRLPAFDYNKPVIYDVIHEKMKLKFSPLFDNVTKHSLGSKIIHESCLYSVDLKSWTFINHGAFGGTLSPILYENSLWREEVEKQPLKFFDRDLFGLLVYSLREMAKVLKCPPDEIFPMQNVTSALNLVLNSIPLATGDEILFFNLTYGSTKKMIHHYASISGAQAKQINLQITSEQEIIEQILNSLTKKSKVLILDHITSNTALELPIHSIAKAVKRATNNQVSIVIDAAHSLFSQHLSLYNENDASESLANSIDFWITNGHKWFSAGKGSALLWISPRIERVKPLIISHGFQPSATTAANSCSREKLLSALIWDGCRDYISFLTMPSTKKIWDSLSHNIADFPFHTGDEWQGYRDYIRQLLAAAEDLLSEEWSLRPEDFLSTKEFRSNTPMRLIPLPAICKGHNTRSATDQLAFQFQELLHHEYRIEVPVKCLEQRLFVRISAHVYNQLSDYQRLAMALKE